MTDIQHATTAEPRLIAAGRLTKSPLNVRRTVAATGMAELKASLLPHGLMQNLVVTDEGDGRYRVIAGGRRLEAIHALQFEGKLPAEFEVPCQVVSGVRARELSLAENTVRLAMHPADQFEAFAGLIEQGESAAEVARRFTLQPKLGPVGGEEATAYDAALSLTEANVADYWRPSKDNFLSRINREQLLAIGREVLGEQWAQSRAGDKKASLVDQLDRAFSKPDKSGRAPEQVAKLKSWLPQGMAFSMAATAKEVKAKKAKKAA